MSTLNRVQMVAAMTLALAACSRSANQGGGANPASPAPNPPPPSTPAPLSKKTVVLPPIAEMPDGSSQVGGLAFKATDDAAVSLVKADSDGGAQVQGSISVEIANLSTDLVSIIVSGNGVTVKLDNGKTIDNVEVKGLKTCFNTKDQCAIGQKGDFVQVPPATAGGGSSGQPISVIMPFQFYTQAAETAALKHITSADVVGTLFLTDANGTHAESLHINRIPLKNFTALPQ